MNYFELNTYREICKGIENGDFIVSFEPQALEDSRNLTYEILNTPYPHVICAFLMAGTFKMSEGELLPFAEFIPPTAEEMEEFLSELDGKVPEEIPLYCKFQSPYTSVFEWEGIQYIRFFPRNQEVQNHSYSVIQPGGKVIRGLGDFPYFTAHVPPFFAN